MIGFALVAGAIFITAPTPMTQVGGVNPEKVYADEPGGHVDVEGSPKRDTTQQRNIYGNVDAETTIVEFSDFECPFCSRLHPTLKQLVDESEGSLNWEYRHLPLASHKGARPAAIASECVADLAGNDAFWNYLDEIFANQRSLTPDFLQSQASRLGVDESAYTSCIASSEIADRVEADLQAAIKQGGSGTPYSVIEFADGSTKVVSGALPYQNWVQTLNIN